MLRVLQTHVAAVAGLLQELHLLAHLEWRREKDMPLMQLPGGTASRQGGAVPVSAAEGGEGGRVAGMLRQALSC